MPINERNRKLLNSPSIESVILVEFLSFLDQPWGRMSPFSDVEILDAGTVYTYSDYFISFPQIARSFDIFKGGLDKVSNITLTLNNNENLIKSLRAVTLENTQVKIWMLLNAGGTLNKSDGELRFWGSIDSIVWDDEKITLKISEIAQKYNTELLTTKITKKDYRLIDESIDNKYLPIIGGQWSTNVRDNTDSDDPGYFTHSTALNCATPTYLMNKESKRFLLADHPIKTTADQIDATNTYDESDMSEFPHFEVRRPIGRIFQYDQNDTYLPMYNLNAGLQADNTMLFVINDATKDIQGMLRPPVPVKVDTEAELSNLENIFDDDLVEETGLSCDTFMSFDSPDWQQIWFTFKDLDLLEFDPNNSAVHIEVLCEGTSGSGRFLMRTDGLGVKCTTPEGSALTFKHEVGVKSIYRLKIAESGNDLVRDQYFTPTETTKDFRTINLVHNNWYNLQANFLNKSVWRDDDDYDDNSSFLRVPPPINVTAPRTDIAFAEIVPQFLDADRLGKWEFGIEGRLGLKIKRVFLRIQDIVYEGGIVPDPQPREYYKIARSRTRRHQGRETTESEERYIRWIEEKADIENRSNAQSVYAMVDGLTSDNTSGGTLVRDPISFIKWLLNYRMNGASYDSNSFTIVEGRRAVSDSQAFQHQWENHIFIGTQKTSHDVLSQLCSETGCSIYNYLGDYYLLESDWGLGFASRWNLIGQYDENEILEYSFDFNEVYDSFIINYAKDYGSGKYRKQLYVNPTDTNYYDEDNAVFDNTVPGNYDVTGFNSTNLKNGCYSVWSDYYQETDTTKLHELEISLDYIQNTNTARRALINLLLKYTKQRSIVTFKMGMVGLELKIGDQVWLSHVDWSTNDSGRYLIFSCVENLARGEFTFKALNISSG